jgi:hypothetical protein
MSAIFRRSGHGYRHACCASSDHPGALGLAIPIICFSSVISITVFARSRNLSSSAGRLSQTPLAARPAQDSRDHSTLIMVSKTCLPLQLRISVDVPVGLDKAASQVFSTEPVYFKTSWSTARLRMPSISRRMIWRSFLRRQFENCSISVRRPLVGARYGHMRRSRQTKHALPPSHLECAGP